VKRQIAVIGLGSFGIATTRALFEMGHEVLAIDNDEAPLNEVMDHATHVVQADGCDRAAMEELGVGSLDVAIVAIAELEASILTFITLKDLGVPQVIARASNAVHAQILEKLGVNRVILAEQETALRLAHTFAVRQALDYMSLDPDYGVAKLAPPESFIGRTLQEIELRQKYDVSLIALLRQDAILFYPRSDERIRATDLIVVAGRDEKLEHLGN
jgi:trk system potassium uptake protein TrkA